MAKNLALVGIETILVTDSASFAIMSRVTKVRGQKYICSLYVHVHVHVHCKYMYMVYMYIVCVYYKCIYNVYPSHLDYCVNVYRSLLEHTQ